MPNRYLRASYIDSKRINELSPEGERMFVRLLVHVDDFGRCEADPDLLLGKLFARQLGRVSIKDVQSWINELNDKNLVTLYVVGGENLYLQMNKWERGRALTSKHPSPESAEKYPGDEHKGKRNKQVLLADFELFWNAYPRKVAKPAAVKAFIKHKDKPDIRVILDALERQKKSDQWAEEKFIPHAATWINQERWNDEESKPKKNIRSFEDD
jgi:hypothetical protein